MVFVPLAPEFPNNSLDSGWTFGLNAALPERLVFGRDITFTFGPYASVFTTQFSPATDTQMLCGAGLLAIAFASGLICLAQNLRLTAIGFAIFLILLPRDTQFFAVPLIFLLLICRVMLPPGHRAYLVPSPSVQATLVLTVLALGLLTLVKGNFALAAGSVMALGCGLLTIRGYRRLAAGGVILFMASVLALWCFAHQPVAGLPGFFLSQQPLISGYSAAMSLSGPGWQIAIFMICSLLLMALTARPLFLAGAAGRILFTGAMLIGFLAFKEGFVRDDTHSAVAAGMLGVMGWAILLGGKGWAPSAALAIGLVGWALGSAPQARLSVHMLIGNIETAFLTAEDGLVLRLTQPRLLPQYYTNWIDFIKAQQPLPKLSGTTDIYSAGQSALLANGLDWDPRPVFQSYSVYTPALERRNAAHLTGAGAPDNIFFAVQPIDGRLPALEDGASWPALLTRYKFVGLSNGLAILRKRATPATLKPFGDQPNVTGNFRLGQLISLPGNLPLVWATIDISPTLAGRLVTLLFKPPQLSISYVFANGGRQTFRYIAGMGAAGFLAAPVVQTTSEFAALALPHAPDYFAGRKPISLSINADYGAGWLWRSSFTLSFRALQIPPQPTVTQVIFAPFKTSPRA